MYTTSIYNKIQAVLKHGERVADEIALSIIAEIMMLRKKASGASLKTIQQLLEDEVLA